MSRSSKLIRAIFWVCFAAGNCASAGATLLTPDQSFFDPDTLPLAIYPRDPLYPVVSGTGVSGNTVSWSGGIIDVDILPMLKPFSAIDPAGYPIGYSFSSSDYLYQPLVDYTVDLTSGTATASFNKEGIYHVRLTRSDGTQEVRAVLANAGTLGGDEATRASVPIKGPSADFVIVSKPTGGDATLDIANDNAVDDNGASKVDRASSVADAVNKIRDAYRRNGNQRIHLEIVAHGSASYFELGDTKVGVGGSMTIKEFQDLIDQYVKELSIYACNFAAGPGLATLAASIGTASSYDGFVSVHRSWFGLSRGWDLELRRVGLSATAIPEPDSTLLQLIGLIALICMARGRCNPRRPVQRPGELQVLASILLMLCAVLCQLIKQPGRLFLRPENGEHDLGNGPHAPQAEQVGLPLHTAVVTFEMPDLAGWFCLIAIVLCSFSCPAQATPMFNVIGTETKNDVSLSFIIFDTTGTALPSKSWDSKTTQYQDEATDTFLLLQFWEVLFSYDAAKTSFSLTAFHKIDPHSGGVNAGDTYSWSDVRPAATKARGSSGALFGEVSNSDSKNHMDSKGAHKDSYTADAVYITNLLDPASGTRLDQFTVEVIGTHCSGAVGTKSFIIAAEACACACTVPVSEPSSFAMLCLGMFGIFACAWRRQGVTKRKSKIENQK